MANEVAAKVVIGLQAVMCQNYIAVVGTAFYYKFILTGLEWVLLAETELREKKVKFTSSR